MRRILTVAAMIVTAAGGASAAEVPVTSSIQRVTVFPSGAEVTRTAKIALEPGQHTLILSNLPAQTTDGSVRVEGQATAGLAIGSVDTRRLFIPLADEAAAETERKRLEEEIERLQDDRALIQGEVEAAQEQRNLIRNLAQLPVRPGDKEAGAPREDWPQLLALIGASMSDVQKAEVAAQARLRDLDRRIADLQNKLGEIAPRQEERTEVKVHVTAEAALEGEIVVRYQVPGASWSPSYDARLATGSKTAAPKLQLVRRATISQRTGEAWENIDIALSTTRPRSGSAAPELQTMSVDFQPEVRPYPGGGAQSMDAAPVAEAEPQMAPMARSAPAKLAARPVMMVEAKIENAPFQAIYIVPGKVSVAETGEAKRVQLGSDEIDVALGIRTVPKVSEEAYLYVKMKLPAREALLPGPVSLFRDQTFVGTGRLPTLAGGAEHELGFGIDDLVRVRHAVAEEKRGESGLISSSATDSRFYKITVKNLHERAVDLTVIDQVPVSKNQDIRVEILGRTQPTERDLDDRRGVIAWKSPLGPDEERQIEFGYRVTWPAAKKIQYGQ